ncbi:DUF3108 domain-containing protein, partial [Janthinobacterium sp. hw3]|nr:DUF3108 domain-containing protein [Janthinobacterium fluminis]
MTIASLFSPPRRRVLVLGAATIALHYLTIDWVGARIGPLGEAAQPPRTMTAQLRLAPAPAAAPAPPVPAAKPKPVRKPKPPKPPAAPPLAAPAGGEAAAAAEPVADAAPGQADGEPA